MGRKTGRETSSETNKQAGREIGCEMCSVRDREAGIEMIKRDELTDG